MWILVYKVHLKRAKKRKLIYTKYNGIFLQVNTAQRVSRLGGGMCSLSTSCLVYMFILLT